MKTPDNALSLDQSKKMPPVPPRGATILVVEDEIIVARDICLQLAEQGFAPVGDTADGESAIAMTESLRPDLVLMDINLRGRMNGITAAGIIRDRFALPVVFLSAYNGDDIRNRAKAVEPYGYLVKPFDELDLHAVIESALSKHRAEHRRRGSRAEDEAEAESSPAESTDTIDSVTGDAPGTPVPPTSRQV